jgi:hypothetical protein
MVRDCFFCGFDVDPANEFQGDACALCNMMHDITRREPEIIDIPVEQVERLYYGFTYPIM